MLLVYVVHDSNLDPSFLQGWLRLDSVRAGSYTGAPHPKVTWQKAPRALRRLAVQFARGVEGWSKFLRDRATHSRQERSLRWIDGKPHLWMWATRPGRPVQYHLCTVRRVAAGFAPVGPVAVCGAQVDSRMFKPKAKWRGRDWRNLPNPRSRCGRCVRALRGANSQAAASRLKG